MPQQTNHLSGEDIVIWLWGLENVLVALLSRPNIFAAETWSVVRLCIFLLIVSILGSKTSIIIRIPKCTIGMVSG